MANHVNSLYTGDTITVSEIVGNPTWIAERITSNLDGTRFEEKIFRDGGSNEGVVAFREAAAPFLNDEAENVAEFAEIPVADLNTGRARSVVAAKTAQGVRASYEMAKFNQIGLLAQQVDALQKTFRRTSVRASLRAFDRAAVPELQAVAPWSSRATADPATDVNEAIERIMSATIERGDEEEFFDYVPNLIAMHPRLKHNLFRADEVQDRYIGNAAINNPLSPDGSMTKVETAFGLEIYEDRYLPQDEVIIMEAGAVGFKSTTIPFTVTGFYNEGAPSSVPTFGPTMSQRCDAVHKRVIAIDNPKAAIRLKGVSA